MKDTLTAETSITIEAPVENVWEALTTPALIKKYLMGTKVTSDWKEGSPKPFEDFRLYTKHDLTVRLSNVAKKNGCEMVGEINYEGEPDFWYGNFNYSFASLIFKKTIY